MKEVLEEKLPYVNSFVLVKKKMMNPKFNYVVSLPFLILGLSVFILLLCCKA